MKKYRKVPPISVVGREKGGTNENTHLRNRCAFHWEIHDDTAMRTQQWESVLADVDIITKSVTYSVFLTFTMLHLRPPAIIYQYYQISSQIRRVWSHPKQANAKNVDNQHLIFWCRIREVGYSIHLGFKQVLVDMVVWDCTSEACVTNILYSMTKYEHIDVLTTKTLSTVRKMAKFVYLVSKINACCLITLTLITLSFWESNRSGNCLASLSIWLINI